MALDDGIWSKTVHSESPLNGNNFLGDLYTYVIKDVADRGSQASPFLPPYHMINSIVYDTTYITLRRAPKM